MLNRRFKLSKCRIMLLAAGIIVPVIGFADTTPQTDSRSGSKSEKNETLEQRAIREGGISISAEASSSSHAFGSANGEGFSASSADGQNESQFGGDTRYDQNGKSKGKRKVDSRSLTQSQAQVKAEAKSQVGIKVQFGNAISNKPAVEESTPIQPRTSKMTSKSQPAPTRPKATRSRTITVQEIDRQITITEKSPGTIEFRITPTDESGNATGDPKTYTAKDLKQLSTDRPDLSAIYEEHARKL